MSSSLPLEAHYDVGRHVLRHTGDGEGREPRLVYLTPGPSAAYQLYHRVSVRVGIQIFR